MLSSMFCVTSVSPRSKKMTFVCRTISQSGLRPLLQGIISIAGGRSNFGMARMKSDNLLLLCRRIKLCPCFLVGNGFGYGRWYTLVWSGRLVGLLVAYGSFIVVVEGLD